MRSPPSGNGLWSASASVRLLEAAPGLKYKAAFGVAYGTGLRFVVVH
jgi:hypothetical protein